MTERGGNPNLLWNPASKALTVIDHNRVFDPEFSEEAFRQTHVFAPQLADLVVLQAHKDAYLQRFASAMDVWRQACDNLPPVWWFLDEEETLPTSFDLPIVQSFLERFDRDDFWNLVI